MDSLLTTLKQTFLETFSDHGSVQQAQQGINFIFCLNAPERGTQNSKAALCKEGESILTEGEWWDLGDA